MRPRSDQLQRPWTTNLTQAAFVLASALVIARATFLESVRDTEPVASEGPLNAGATTALLFDLLICVPALLVLLRRVIDPSFQLRRTISHILLGALGLLAVCSTFWASDKFLAAVTSFHLLAAAVLVWTMTQLVHSWLRLRLVAGMCFGLLLVYVANGAIYRLVDVPDNIKYWQENKDEELRKRGWEPGSFQAIQFENKIINGEMVGFNSSPNTFAAMIVMLGVVCIGVVIQRFADNDQPGWPLIVMIGLVAAGWIVHYTHSKAALVTPLIAGGILVALALMRDALARWRKPLFFTGCVAFALAAIAVTFAGRARGNLFASSLTFRWHYWIGAARIVERHPMVGIGWGNFGMHYVGVRLPVASEEVKDPHNLIVRAFAELGIVGGVLMIAWLARLWWELCAAKSLALKSESLLSSYGRGLTMKTFATICGLAMAFNIAASIDFSSATPDAGWFILLQLMKRALFFGLLLLGYAAVTLRSSQVPQLDHRPAPWIMYAMLAALAVFLLHNLIDFSMFEPGVMGVFAALVGASLGLRAQAAEYDSRTRALVGLSVAAVLWLAAAIGLFAPVATAESSARRGDELIRAEQPRTAATQFRRAFEQLWIPNADYPYRAAMALARAGAPVPDIRALLDTAIAANSMDASFHRTRAKLELEQPNPDANRVIESFQEATALDPNDVWLHLEFADALVRLGMRAHALEEYRQALRYNDLLGPDEPKRLPPAELQKVQGKIKAIEP